MTVVFGFRAVLDISSIFVMFFNILFFRVVLGLFLYLYSSMSEDD